MKQGDSPVLPKGWELKKLGDFYEITSSKRVFKAEWQKSGVPFYRAREIVKLAQQGFVENELFISDDMYSQYSAKYGIPKVGDIMVTGVGTLGICYVVKKGDRFYFKDGNIIWLKKQSEINSQFVEYAFKSEFLRKQIDNSIGATVGTFTIIKAKHTLIPVPQLTEQKRIVAILDKTFSAIDKAKDKAEQNLKNAKELFESYFESIFGNTGNDWKKKKINEVCLLKSGTTIPPTLERKKGDVLYTKISDMNLPENIVEIHTSSRFVNSNEIKQNQIIPEGAIIFPKRGGAIATNKKRKIIKPTIVDLNTMAIIPSKKINKDYLFHWFQMFDLNDISNGANIPQINNYSFDEIYISYPVSLKEQQTIVQKLDALSTKIKKLESIYQKKIDDLEELKKSILQKAFNGELTSTKLIAV